MGQIQKLLPEQIEHTQNCDHHCIKLQDNPSKRFNEHMNKEC